MYGDQSYVYQRIAATLYVVACLGGVEGGRGGGSEVKGEELGSGKKGGRLGREDILFPFRFSLPFPVSRRPPPRLGLWVYTGAQEPITRIVQLPCAHVTAFSRTSLLLERFWREFCISFKLRKFLPFNNV